MKSNTLESNKSYLQDIFDRLQIRLNIQPCMFITVYKPDYSLNDNQTMNNKLESEIEYSGLSYIKFIGNNICDDLFLVINNLYHTNDFERLADYWYNMFEQENLLVTKPSIIPYGKGDEKYRKSIPVTGIYYYKNEEVIIRHNLSMTDVSEYIDYVFGDLYLLDSYTEHITEAPYQIYKPSSAPWFCSVFKKKYPKLRKDDK